MNYFLAVLGLYCCAGFCLVAVNRGYSLVAVSGLFIVVASPAGDHGLWSLWTLAAVVHGLSCPVACGIFSD